jgi:hypothetical protein
MIRAQGWQLKRGHYTQTLVPKVNEFNRLMAVLSGGSEWESN